MPEAFLHSAASLLEPVGLLWFIFILSALSFLAKRKWIMALGAFCLAAGLSVVGSTSLPFRLLARLEEPYAGVKLDRLPAADAIVMLGGTLMPSSRDLFGFELEGTCDRALTAAQLARLNKSSVLILGGGKYKHLKETEGQLLARWLAAWNVTPAPALTLAGSADTHDEALQVQKLAKQNGWKKIILVTSAFHMRRAEAIFRTLGMEVIPAPCDFSGLAHLEAGGPFKPVPDAEGLFPMQLYLHEIIGWHYYRWKGWIGPGRQAERAEMASERTPRPSERMMVPTN